MLSECIDKRNTCTRSYCFYNFKSDVLVNRVINYPRVLSNHVWFRILFLSQSFLAPLLTESVELIRCWAVHRPSVVSLPVTFFSTQICPLNFFLQSFCWLASTCTIILTENLWDLIFLSNLNNQKRSKLDFFSFFFFLQFGQNDFTVWTWNLPVGISEVLSGVCKSMSLFAGPFGPWITPKEVKMQVFVCLRKRFHWIHMKLVLPSHWKYFLKYLENGPWWALFSGPFAS